MTSKFSLRGPLRLRWQVVLGSSLIVVAFLSSVPKTVDGQVSETPNRWIRGVAKVTLDSNGKSQIAFNPRRCRELGPELCEFFRTHEYGHVNLRHLERGVPASRAEAEADIWAAQNASPNAVRAAKQFFLSGKGGSRVHGSPQERARRMDVGRSSTLTQASTVYRNGPAAKTAPKSYSATSKRWVRYQVKQPASSNVRVQTNDQPTQVFEAPPRTRTAIPAKLTTKPTRYVIVGPPKVSQSRGQTSLGYVPRGDFLNPR